MKILFIHTHGLHLGFLGCYGNDWVATPNLDRLAAEGIVFDQHYVDRPTFTVEESNVLRDLVSFPELEWVEMHSLLPPWNLPADLIGVYGEDEEESVPPWPDPPIGPISPDAYTDLERLQNTYAAAVTYWDARLGEVLQPLRDSGRLDDLLVCVTASSGLPLGEHGQIGPHRPWLHEEVMHAPLLLRLPGAQEAGLRISALTQPADLIPTLHEHLGIAQPASAGQNLWPLIRGEIAQVRPHAVSTWQIGPASERTIRTLEWMLILPEASFPGEPPREPQLYKKPDDRWEVNDVRQQNLDLAEELETILRLAAGDS